MNSSVTLLSGSVLWQLAQMQQAAASIEHERKVCALLLCPMARTGLFHVAWPCLQVLGDKLNRTEQSLQDATQNLADKTAAYAELDNERNMLALRMKAGEEALAQQQAAHNKEVSALPSPRGLPCIRSMHVALQAGKLQALVDEQKQAIVTMRTGSSLQSALCLAHLYAFPQSTASRPNAWSRSTRPCSSASRRA